MRAPRAIVGVMILASVCAGCGRTTATPPVSTPGSSSSTPSQAATTEPSSPAAEGPAGSVAVRFSSIDRIRLAGRLFGGGPAGIVLAHQNDDNQTDWWDFAETLRAKGYMVLTFDYRGICPRGLGGCSKGAPDVTAAWKDVMGAARFLRSRGARWVALIGASMGGEASIIAASRLGGAVDALVCLSASEGFVGPLDPAVAHRTVAAVVAPKLFVAGRSDPGFASYAADYFKHSQPPRVLKVVDSGDHGIDLLRSGDSNAVTALVLRFLHAHR